MSNLINMYKLNVYMFVYISYTSIKLIIAKKFQDRKMEIQAGIRKLRDLESRGKVCLEKRKNIS